ncbi:MAG TPA: glycosyltransferase family 1 protein [bacterium (Candidatus Stahlbacteria)]|nr:glycosyltransferase family 1 protein [Candidatus Stahlbacteria bacterium]
MNILIASDNYYPRPGGISEHIYHVAKELRKLGHNVKILTTHHGRSKSTEDIIRIGIALPFFSNWSFTRLAVGINVRGKVKRFMKRNKFDIVHVHGLTPFLPLYALRYSDAKNVATFHVAFETFGLYTLFRKLLKNYHQKIDAAVAVSKVAEKSMQMYFPGEYRIIPNGIDIERFNPNVKPFDELKDGFNVLFVGRFEPRKGLIFLIEAFPKVLAEAKDARLIIVGSGNIKAIIPPKIRKHVYVVPYARPEDIPRYYVSADVFVSPAIAKESFGIVLLEAMASGRPVIASDIPGYRCAMKEGEGGIFVPPKDPDSIARAILELYNNPNLRRELGIKGRKHATLYSWNKVAKKLEALYYELLSK